MPPIGNDRVLHHDQEKDQRCGSMVVLHIPSTTLSPLDPLRPIDPLQALKGLESLKIRDALALGSLKPYKT